MNPKLRVSINPDIILQDLDDQKVLLNPNTGHIFGLDIVSNRVWELLTEKENLGEVKRQMLEDFEVEEARLEKDLEAYIQQLLELDLAKVEP